LRETPEQFFVAWILRRRTCAAFIRKVFSKYGQKYSLLYLVSASYLRLKVVRKSVRLKAQQSLLPEKVK